ncbi:MAG: hypothetical protein FK733_11580 [Asgard group archaeon]|nr:hypothetical protein [Asgard group archaeon]
MRGKKTLVILGLIVIPLITSITVSSYLVDPSEPVIQVDNPALEYVLISLYFLTFIPVIILLRRTKKKQEKTQAREETW